MKVSPGREPERPPDQPQGGQDFELIHYPQVPLICYVEDDTLTIHCNNISHIHTIIITHKP